MSAILSLAMAAIGLALVCRLALLFRIEVLLGDPRAAFAAAQAVLRKVPTREEGSE